MLGGTESARGIDLQPRGGPGHVPPGSNLKIRGEIMQCRQLFNIQYRKLA